MRTKHTFRLPLDLSDQLADRAARMGVAQTQIVEAALRSLLSPDGADRLEAAISRRLDRLSRQADRLEHHVQISNEAVAMYGPMSLGELGALLVAEGALAEASKLVPRAVVCLTSALAFHDLTDRMPPKVWLAIDRADRLPRHTQPPMRFVRFSLDRMGEGYAPHQIEGVDVPITDAAHTVIDMFRYRNAVGLPVAIEGLKEALRTRKASPGDLARVAARNRTWTVVRPYLEALAHDG